MSQLIRGISAREVDIRLESHNNIRLLTASWNMGNAKAEGLEHLLPHEGGEYDLIVLGLQESTYNIKEKKDKIGGVGGGGDKEFSSKKMGSSSDSEIERPTSAKRKSKHEACVTQLLNQIEAVLGHEFSQVTIMIVEVVLLYFIIQSRIT